MKTCTLVVTLAFLMSAVSPVFAMTHQQQLACAWTAGNCFDEAKILEKRVVEIKNEMQKNANASPEEVKNLEKKLQDTMIELKRVEEEI